MGLWDKAYLRWFLFIDQRNFYLTICIDTAILRDAHHWYSQFVGL